MKTDQWVSLLSLQLTAVLLSSLSLPAGAVPGPPVGCGGNFGDRGCAPYTQVFYATDASTANLFEYDQVPLAFTHTDGFGTVRGQADLTTGDLKVFGQTNNDGNPSTTHGAIISVGASDVFTLHGAPSSGLSFVQFSISMTADGVAGIDTLGYVDQALVQFSGPSLAVLPGGGLGYDRRIYQAGQNVPVLTDFGVHLLASENAVMPLETPFQLDTLLRADLTEATYMDLSHTAHLTFSLPVGVTISSLGGYAAAVSAVPEPSNWALMFAGFALATGMTRRRKSKDAP